MTVLRALDVRRDWPGVCRLVPVVLCADTAGIVAERDGELIGVMLGDNWTPTSVQVHQGVSDRAAFRAGLHIEFARWVFEVGGRRIMWGLTPADNTLALRVNTTYGFREVCRLPDALDEGRDLVIMQLTREAWVDGYLKQRGRRYAVGRAGDRDGQAVRTRAA